MTTQLIQEVDEALLDLAWSLWGALGVSSWTEQDTSVVVEVEPLLVFTAYAASEDPRLIREVAAWAAAQMPLLSVRQFKHVVTAQRWPFAGPVDDLSRHLTRATGRSWPGGTSDVLSVGPSDRPAEVDLRSRAALQLRLRALLGVSARAEVVRMLLLNDHPMTVSDLGERLPYTRRQISGDVDLLAKAGFVKRSSATGPLRVSLANRESMTGLLGPIGHDYDWAPAFRLLTGLRDLVADLTTHEWAEPRIEVRRQLRRFTEQRERVDFEFDEAWMADGPRGVAGEALRLVELLRRVRSQPAVA